MKIANWIFKAAADESREQSINLTDAAYEDLLTQYHEGKLDDVDADTLEEIEFLRDLINVAATKLIRGTTKEAAPKPLPNKKPGDETVMRTVEKVPPPLPSGATFPERKKLPGKSPEPEATKWKEIRFNKREGKWQVIVSLRTVRNFNTEEEALDYAKKL